MKRIFFQILFIGLTLSLSSQVDSIINMDTTQIEEVYEVISAQELEFKSDSILSNNRSYYSSFQIANFISLQKEDLPELTDEIIALKMKSLPTTLNIRFTPEIGNMIRKHLYYNRSFIVRMLTKSQYYFPLYEVELDKRNMPLELKYVSVIESHLNPQARSPMGATGLWQFMYATAKYKGMYISTLEDPRKDPLTSTQFASDYLLQLYNIYDDWLLAISAYNAGAGNINKAIRAANGVKNYWVARPFMPRETQQYVPKIIAVMYAMYYANEYMLYAERPDYSYWDIHTVQVYDKISLKYASELLGMQEEELIALNPVLTKKITPKRDTGYPLNIPTSRNFQFEENSGFFFDDPYLVEEYKELEEKQVDQYQASAGTGTGKYISYVIETGDNLGFIAEKFGCRVSQLKSWNGLNSNFLRVGKKLRIYGVSKQSEAQVSKPEVTYTNVGFKDDEINTSSCSCHKHQIISGDNLWDISRKYNTTVEQIKAVNNIPKNWRLKLGIFLKIPKS